MIFCKDLCIHTRTRRVNVGMRVLSRQNARTHVYASCVGMCARIFTKNHLINLYYLMNKSLKFHFAPNLQTQGGKNPAPDLSGN